MAQPVGYLMVDHRASPGIPEELASASGYDPALAKEGKMFEADTMACEHCKTVVAKNPFRQRARESCPKCSGRYVCDFCYADMQRADYSHDPYEKRVADAYRMLGTLGSPSRLLMPGD